MVEKNKRLSHMNNLTVSKSNKLNEASYRLTLQEQRLILACIAPLDSRNNLPKKEVTITASEYAEYFQLDMKNAYRELYKAADGLYNRSIKLKGVDEDIELRWVQKKVLKTKGEGTVTLLFSDEIINYIAGLKSHFTSYKMRHVAELKSVYSIRLYELLIQFKKTGERTIHIEELRELLGVDDKYSQFRDFNKWIIKPAIAELNTKSDLTIQLETVKKGRKIHAITFNFTLNDQMKMDI
jgi:plasmid replication initiation protein